jgi:hypothetical protein
MVSHWALWTALVLWAIGLVPSWIRNLKESDTITSVVASLLIISILVVVYVFAVIELLHM